MYKVLELTTSVVKLEVRSCAENGSKPRVGKTPWVVSVHVRADHNNYLPLWCKICLRYLLVILTSGQMDTLRWRS